MLCGQVAFNASTVDEFEIYMQNTPWEEIKPNLNDEFQYLSEEAKDLILKLLLPPDKRLGRTTNIKELIMHPFFTQRESLENILCLNNTVLRKMIQIPAQMTEEELQQLPLIPYEPLLKHIRSPWQPVL